jgi:hypothetical protein
MGVIVGIELTLLISANADEAKIKVYNFILPFA